MKSEPETRAMSTMIADVLESQRFGVLASRIGDGPYTSLVAFVAAKDLSYLLFATTRATRKYANITKNASVAMLIDTRTNTEADFRNAAAVTALGIAREIDVAATPNLLERYVSRHPHLKVFATAESSALFKISIERYFIVQRFQNVMELRMTP